MTRRVDYGRNKRAMAMADNALRMASDTVTLSCGHEVTGPPLATKGDGTRLWSCPEGCGLLKAKAR